MNSYLSQHSSKEGPVINSGTIPKGMKFQRVISYTKEFNYSEMTGVWQTTRYEFRKVFLEL